MDQYVYPSTSVLRNLREILDPELLSEFEAEATARRLRQLENKPLSGRFRCHVCLEAIHHILQVSDGRLPDCEYPHRSSPSHSRSTFIQSLDKTCGELTREGYLAGCDLERFVVRGAYYLGEINAVHPFREGNGRAQREFIRELALRNGLMIDWRQVSREEMIEASRRSLRVDNAGLEQVLRKAL